MRIAEITRQDFNAWKGHASCIVPFIGCNFRCGYCDTPQLVKAMGITEMLEDEALDLIETLHSSNDAVILSGAEPTIQEGFSKFCRKVKSFGYNVKLETNGSRPDVIKQLIAAKLVDFIALDIKAPPQKYKQFCGVDAWNQVKESKRIITENKIDHEIIVTLIPSLITEKELRTIVWNIQNSKRLIINLFRNVNCLDPRYERIMEYAPKQIENIANDIDFDGKIYVKEGYDYTRVR